MASVDKLVEIGRQRTLFMYFNQMLRNYHGHMQQLQLQVRSMSPQTQTEPFTKDPRLTFNDGRTTDVLKEPIAKENRRAIARNLQH